MWFLLQSSQAPVKVWLMFRYFAAMIKQLIFLLNHEIRLEFRQKHALAGIALFSLSTIYVCYQAFRTLEDTTTWNALLWIILLFTAFNAIGKSFSNETRGHRLYLYWVVKPQLFVLAKIIYNALLMCVLALMAFAVYVLFMGGIPVGTHGVFAYLLGLLLGSIGFACLLTLISGIASRTDTGVGLTAVLGLPIAIPLILILMRYSALVLRGVALSENLENLLFLVLLNTGMATLTFLLFPYLWRD
jgi:heme exporter protein B